MVLARNVFLAALLSLAIAGTASAEVRCSLVSRMGEPDEMQGPDFIFREGVSGAEAVYLSEWHGALVLKCHNAIVDEFECYGFFGAPGEAPIQLNIAGFEGGQAVVLTALNLLFMNTYLSAGAEPVDKTTRRFSVDHYRIAECR